MLKVYNRMTGEEVAVMVEDIMAVDGKSREQAEIIHGQRTYTILCNPCYGRWMDLSEEYMSVINRYKGKAKLVKYVPTQYDRALLKTNPDHINDMPRWYVPGLDRALCSEELGRKMRVEFVRRFDAEDEVVIDMVNRCNPTYKIVKIA